MWNRRPRCAECGKKLRPEERVAIAVAGQPFRRATLAELGKPPDDAVAWHEACFAQMTGEPAGPP
jgi:hypothetical protein